MKISKIQVLKIWEKTRHDSIIHWSHLPGNACEDMWWQLKIALCACSRFARAARTSGPNRETWFDILKFKDSRRTREGGSFKRRKESALIAPNWNESPWYHSQSTRYLFCMSSPAVIRWRRKHSEWDEMTKGVKEKKRMSRWPRRYVPSNRDDVIWRWHRDWRWLSAAPLIVTDAKAG